MREQVPLKPGTAKISGDLSPKKPNTIFFPVEKARWLRCRAVNKLQAELQRRNVWCLDDGITAGSGRAIRFVRCRLRAGDMIEHMIAVDESEAAIGELHALAVDAYEFGWGCQENAADIDGGLKGGDERRNFCLRCTMAENARSGNPIGEVGRRTVAPQVAVVTPAVRRVKLRSNRFHRCNALQCAAMSGLRSAALGCGSQAATSVSQTEQNGIWLPRPHHELSPDSMRSRAISWVALKSDSNWPASVHQPSRTS